ncbi:MAG: YgdI/YgdR family lipoprotein [Clostridia bacterium]|nr:YgdI/YgdR family lipoprotein [Clostridia bacterium]
MTLTKKYISLFLALIMLFLLSACSFDFGGTDYTAEDANTYLTEFFSDYTSMIEYINRSDIAISAFALDGAGISALLRALYQSQSVTYAFTYPVESSDNVFRSNVTVVSIDLAEIDQLYQIDREIALESGTSTDGDFVAQSFYNNIQTNSISQVQATVTVTVRVTDDVWYVDSSDDLAYAIFPNIQSVS